MQAVHADDWEWETLRWPGQESKMLFHPRPERPTEPKRDFRRYWYAGRLHDSEEKYGQIAPRFEKVLHHGSIADRKPGAWSAQHHIHTLTSNSHLSVSTL